jgi:hypothetical protein
MVASFVLRKVVRPREAVHTLTIAPKVWAVNVLLFVCRFDVSDDICLACEKIGGLAVNALTVGVSAVFLFLGISVHVSVTLGITNKSK